jgi:ABC-type glucose/galactose transport system permease subunit
MNAAGPLASLLGVIFGLFLVRFNRKPAAKQMGLVLALIISIIMSLYYLRSFSRTSGDEYFLAGLLGISKYIIDIPFSLAFITGLFLAVWTLGDWLTRLKWLGTILLGSLPAGIFLMYGNNLVQSQVNQGNPLFQPFLGFSLPVVVVNVIALLALWVWWNKAKKGKQVRN